MARAHRGKRQRGVSFSSPPFFFFFLRFTTVTMDYLRRWSKPKKWKIDILSSRNDASKKGITTFPILYAYRICIQTSFFIVFQYFIFKIHKELIIVSLKHTISGKLIKIYLDLLIILKDRISQNTNIIKTL